VVENLRVVTMQMMYCSVDSCLDSTLFAGTVVDKSVPHKGQVYHNLLHKIPAE
jgi:hypothetical protein